MRVKYCNVLLEVSSVVKFKDMLLIDGIEYCTNESTDSIMQNLTEDGYADLSIYSRSVFMGQKV